MVPQLRKAFNQAFTEEKYRHYLHELNSVYGYDISFRVAETPVFIDKTLKHRLINAGNDIVSFLSRPDYKELTKNAIPAGLKVPGEDARPHFLTIDFAICYDEEGNLNPQLIELQGFPSLYCFQDFIGRVAKDAWNVPNDYDYLFSGLDREGYIAMLKKVILNGHNPENVILLEVEPEKQGTRIDFNCTADYIGIPVVCITDILLEGRKLYYMNNGVKTPVHRIYNRVIFDELQRRNDLELRFHMTEPVDVEWAGHPNWFFRISKYTLPFLKSPYVPRTYFLSDLVGYPFDLENYVLKPLFSFAGAGVVYDVTPDVLDAIPEKEKVNYILMRKVQYAPALESPDEPVKTEIRLLYLWPDGEDKPTLVTSLVRFSKSTMMGVKFNKNKTWVGGSVAFFEND